MEASLQNTVALLSRMPASLDALLRGLPDEWTLRNEGENTWTVLDVIGHLVYCERVNWMPRVRQFGRPEAFKHFNRRGHVNEIQGKSLANLLDEFSRMRAENLNELRGMNLGPEQLAMKAEYPVLGMVTLSELLSTWAAHDLTHLHQISRVMAYQYKEAVGPFKAFLGVLKCEGHGS